MDYCERIKDIIKDTDEDWYLLRIEQHHAPDPKFMLKQFRALNSTKSQFGFNNRNFMKRFILGGFHVSYMNGDTGVMLIFCMGKRTLDGNFIKHYTMRYHSSAKMIPKLSITPVKATEGLSLYQVMNKSVSENIDGVFSEGNIPKVRIIKFGCYYGTGDYNE